MYQALIGWDVDINVVNRYNRTALILAVMHKKLDVVTALISSGEFLSFGTQNNLQELC